MAKYKCFIYWDKNCGGIDYWFESQNEYLDRRYVGKPIDDNPIFVDFKKQNPREAERLEIYYFQYCINLYD